MLFNICTINTFMILRHLCFQSAVIISTQAVIVTAHAVIVTAQAVIEATMLSFDLHIQANFTLFLYLF